MPQLRMAYLPQMRRMPLSILSLNQERKEMNTISTKHDCLRKLLHIDYLSAIRHATRVPNNDSVVIYPCNGCDGNENAHLHVGHSITDPIWTLKLRIARTVRRLSQTEELLRNAEMVGASSEHIRRSIKDRGKHLKQLQAELATLTTSKSR